MERKNVVIQLCRLSLEQLNQYVVSILGAPLEHYVERGKIPDVVNGLLSELYRIDKETFFLKELSDKLLIPELKRAVYEYLDIPIPLGFNALVVYDRPFIDRKQYRVTLSNFLNGQHPNILITKGDRYSGRTHSHWFIQHATRNIGLNTIMIDLLDGYKKPKEIRDIVTHIANRMAFPPGELNDRLAMASTQAKGLASAIGGWLTTPAGALTKWCFIFDHYDIDIVKTECREFVDNLVMEVGANPINNVWIILLGHNSIIPRSIKPAIIEEHIFPIQFSDVEHYIEEFAQSKGKSLTKLEINKICSAIFTGLKTPLDVDDMEEMVDRLRAYIRVS